MTPPVLLLELLCPTPASGKEAPRRTIPWEQRSQPWASADGSIQGQVHHLGARVAPLAEASKTLIDILHDDNDDDDDDDDSDDNDDA